MELLAPGFDEDVGENRNRVLSLDDSLHQVQLLNEIVSMYEDFHGRCLLLPSLTVVAGSKEE